ncbi:DUF2339 domain-containing protein [Aggregicoccus sp. 17bor-14]|uniref:DUF2339 domain-containing protein n=1 Tax=Myxococcaceae TaxID=31 RepID=UPI00129C4262|nr:MULTISPECIES: DUF2339 domain-containing protein [Myxococcaceae]MBF5044685.1 DUF2339 domain-containing protein [Simulacricoccus sp. 17bor-14]MRI90429.1 DUF2339 domain-containing protein [Aggregicoccus sp. 17bor-14]
MSWILGLLGALLGFALSENHDLASALLGFGVCWMLVTLSRVRDQLEHSEEAHEQTRRELRDLRAALKRATALAPSPEAEPGAPTAVPAAPPPEREVPLPPAGAALAPPTTGALPPAAAPLAAEAQPPALPPRAPAPPPAPPPPSEPGWDERALRAVQAWFTEGNVPVKVGVLVLFAGVAAALRYAAVQGYYTFPLELRLALIALAALVALGFGWRERVRRPAFGLSLQGGALGVLLLTVFAAFRLYGMLPPAATFAMVLVLVAGAAALAVLQHAQALAALGFLGGYLAPVLISTGSHNHVALFSFYAVMNAAVLAISWRESWRALNLIGFAFTFGVGAAWGARFYRPEHFATVEPFLILFFAFYVGIGLLYVLRQAKHPRPWVDGTLVFGTPLLAFPLQAALLKGQPLALAFSALIVAVLYAGLVVLLHRRHSERLLAEAYGALALGFATLAVPLAFSTSTTTSLWALEGAGAAWLGLRQRRWVPWLGGLALQAFAAVAFWVSVLNPPVGPDWAEYTQRDSTLLLNGHFLGAAMLALAGFVLSRLHDRHRPNAHLGLPLLLWATAWWLGAGAHEVDSATASVGGWNFALAFLGFTLLAAAALRGPLDWVRLELLAAVAAVGGLLAVPIAALALGAPFDRSALWGWSAFGVASVAALWLLRARAGWASHLVHLALLWTLALGAGLQLRHEVARSLALGNGWRFAALVLPLALLTLALWRAPGAAAWPRAPLFPRYRAGWFAPALGLIALAWGVGLFLEGAASPLPYLPLLNPLELALVALSALAVAYVHAEGGAAWPALRRALPFLAFALVSLATLRAVHHHHGEPWGPEVLDSGFAQTCLTVVWSLAGVAACVRASRHRNRPLWLGGAVLMGLVLLKLVTVDRRYMGNLEGIISFLAVGLLLVGVGYFAPSPPRRENLDTP